MGPKTLYLILGFLPSGGLMVFYLQSLLRAAG